MCVYGGERVRGGLTFLGFLKIFYVPYVTIRLIRQTVVLDEPIHFAKPAGGGVLGGYPCFKINWVL